MIGYEVQDHLYLHLSVDSLAEQKMLLLLMSELLMSFEMIVDSLRGGISCILARDLWLVTPPPVLCSTAKAACAKFSTQLARVKLWILIKCMVVSHSCFLMFSLVMGSLYNQSAKQWDLDNRCFTMFYYADPTFNIENICSVMLCPNWKEVWSTLVPESRLDKIESECSKVGEQVHACAVVYMSHWNASWKQLAGSLYNWNHLVVLEKVKHFLPPKGTSGIYLRCKKSLYM